MNCISLPSGRETTLPEGCLLALGCFDGLHAGHRALLRGAGALAKKKGLPFAVWTPENAKNAPHLLESGERTAILSEVFGADFYCTERFEEIRDLSAREFFEARLTGEYGAAALACGENFTFGKDRAGSASTLRALCAEKGVFLYVQKSVTRNGVVVSDSMIRDLLRLGQCGKASRLLAAPYGFSAVPVPGRQIGRRLGFPTINLPLPDGFLLPNGVYAAQIEEQTGNGEKRFYPAVVNVGVHPTFERAPVPLCEAHLLTGQELRIDRRALRVRFFRRLRGEIAFSSEEALIKQIRKDKIRAIDFWKKKDPG